MALADRADAPSLPAPLPGRRDRRSARLSARRRRPGRSHRHGGRTDHGTRDRRRRPRHDRRLEERRHGCLARCRHARRQPRPRHTRAQRRVAQPRPGEGRALDRASQLRALDRARAVFGYAPDVYLYLGYGFTRTSWGFRTEPAKRVQTLRGAITTGDTRGKLEYLGTFRRPASGLGFQIGAFASGVEAFNYFGYGNDSDEIADRARYKTRENVFQFTPVLRYEAGLSHRGLHRPGGAVTRRPRPMPDTLVAEEAPIGVGDFGRVAIRAGLTFDSRQRSVVAAKADYTDTSLRSGDESSVTRCAASRPRASSCRRRGTSPRSTAASMRRRRRMSATHARTWRSACGGRTLTGDYAVVRRRGDWRQQQPRLPQPPLHRRLVALRQRVAARVAGHHRQVVHRACGSALVAFGDVGRVWVEGEDSINLASVTRRRAAPAAGGRADAAARHRGQRQGRHAAAGRVRLPVLMRWRTLHWRRTVSLGQDEVACPL